MYHNIMMDKLHKLFSCFPESKILNISSGENGSDYKHQYYYYNHIQTENETKIWGYVTVDYSDVDTYEDDKIKYICNKVVENNTGLEEEIAKELLTITQIIISNTDAVNGYSVEIIKRENDYIINVPELEHKKYWASEYGYFIKGNED